MTLLLALLDPVSPLSVPSASLHDRCRVSSFFEQYRPLARYRSKKDFQADLKLIFSNCRKYNDEVHRCYWRYYDLCSLQKKIVILLQFLAKDDLAFLRMFSVIYSAECAAGHRGENGWRRAGEGLPEAHEGRTGLGPRTRPYCSTPLFTLPIYIYIIYCSIIDGLFLEFAQWLQIVAPSPVPAKSSEETKADENDEEEKVTWLNSRGLL